MSDTSDQGKGAVANPAQAGDNPATKVDLDLHASTILAELAMEIGIVKEAVRNLENRATENKQDILDSFKDLKTDVGALSKEVGGLSRRIYLGIGGGIVIVAFVVPYLPEIFGWLASMGGG